MKIPSIAHRSVILTLLIAVTVCVSVFCVGRKKCAISYLIINEDFPVVIAENKASLKIISELGSPNINPCAGSRIRLVFDNRIRATVMFNVVNMFARSAYVNFRISVNASPDLEADIFIIGSPEFDLIESHITDNGIENLRDLINFRPIGKSELAVVEIGDGISINQTPAVLQEMASRLNGSTAIILIFDEKVTMSELLNAYFRVKSDGKLIWVVEKKFLVERP